MPDVRVLKLPEVWAREKHVEVLDPDGWRFQHTFSNGKTYKPQAWDVLIDEEEFDSRLIVSTQRSL